MSETPNYQRGDLVWCLFGDGFSNSFFRRDPDEVEEGRVLGVFDNGALLVVEYVCWDSGAVVRDWFTHEQAAKQLRPRTPTEPVSSPPGGATP